MGTSSNDTDPYAVNQTYSFATMEMYDGNIYTNELDKLMKIADLKPERKNSWEIGLDFRTFNNRLIWISLIIRKIPQTRL